MKLAQALKKIPIKHRGKMLQLLDSVIDKTTEELLEKLTPLQSEELKQLRYSDNSALTTFVVSNFPDVEKTIWDKLIAFTEEKCGLREYENEPN